MTFKELLDSVSFEEVAPELVRMYPKVEYDLRWYKIHFDMLRLMTPKLHDDTNSGVCNISMSKWDEDCQPHLDAYPMEGDWWGHSLTKELVIAPEVKATNAEIAACCLWHTSFYGYVDEQQEEYFRFDESDIDIKDRWDDYIYNKIRAEKCFSIIRRNGGYIPSVKELTPAKKQELTNKAKEYFWCISQSMNKTKRKRLFRREFMAHYYERMMNISRFIVQAIPALKDERSNMSIEQLCGLFYSDLFSSEVFTSYADEKTSGARYLCELFEKYGIEPRLDRIVVVLTTGEYHQELTEDEDYLCRLLVGDCKSSDILLATDPSLGRQVRINYATFNSEKTL
ncbi:MAG: hypothetical protein IKP41_01615 [Bacteroidaceae bacterium]|nr:hypothetical protein [Bacteroidaceae bacterium]